LFKEEFKGDRFIGLCAKCYFVENVAEEQSKLSAKGLNQRQNDVRSWDRYKKALDGYFTHDFDKATNIGFRRMNNEIYTYTQTKLGLSASYDKRRLHSDGIHTSPIF
jgi:hypothetical protein